MYDRILITLDATATDRVIIDHIKPLAKLLGSRLVLLHIADGWAARTFGPDAISREVDEDRAYLLKIQQEFEREGIVAEAELGFGEPVKEILRWIEQRKCDLVAMSTHGHRLLGDIVYGSTASRVQHRITIPVLLLRAPTPSGAAGERG